MCRIWYRGWLIRVYVMSCYVTVQRVNKFSWIEFAELCHMLCVVWCSLWNNPHIDVVYHRSICVHIFQLIDFGITSQLLYFVDERQHTQKTFFMFSLFFVVFVILHFSVRFENAKRSQTKAEKRKIKASEWERRSNFYAQKSKQVSRTRPSSSTQRSDLSQGQTVETSFNLALRQMWRYQSRSPIYCLKRFAVYRNPKLKH